ncbi:MAG: TatD family hydrolase [Bacteroidales bacterium]
MNFIDTHTHIYLEQFDNDRTIAIENAQKNSIEKMLVPDIDNAHRKKMLDVCSQNRDFCLPMLGIHPTSVKEDYKNELNLLKIALEKQTPIAIGECGLDYYWDKTFVEQQTEVFIEHLYLAKHYKLPLVIHSRKSLNEIIRLLKQFKHLNVNGVFHCFPGNAIEAEEVMNLGFLLGIGGVVTYKNSTMAEVVKFAPLDRILLETDAPYLPPVPYRGQRNESAYIPVIAKKIAEIKTISLEEVADATTNNAKRLFNL